MLFSKPLVLRHRIMGHDFTFEDPDFNSTHTIGGESRPLAVINLGAERMKRHTAFAIPFRTGDLGTAKATRTIDPHALCAKTHRGLHGALHGAAETDTTFQLLGNVLGNQLGVDLWLSHLNDVQADLAANTL